MATSVPSIQWTPEGVVLPTDQAILSGVQADIDDAFGGGVNPSLSTPQGQIASSETAIIADKNSSIAYLVNQIDPQYAEGRFQDAIGRIYFMTRNPAVSTVVIATIGGLPGTYIAAGALALDSSQNVYQLLAAVTIGTAGTVAGEFANVATGPIPCAAGALNQIYQAIPGWDSIANAAAGILGSTVESPQAFELRRQNSVALNSHGTTDAIFANVYAVAGVLDCYVIDNPSGNTVNYGATNYPLAPHSVYVAVVGGSPTAIAQAIWNAKDGGCGYNGNTTEIVYDTRSQYAPNYPAYNVTFNIPTSAAVYFSVTIQGATTLPSNYVALIQNAILAQFNGDNSNTPAGIASTILASSYYGPVLSALPGVSLLSVLVGLASPATAYDATMGIDQQPTLDVADIVVTVG
ncbi:MAG: baseplate J/gp47 family protein [Sulfobacillus sp.]